jgi:hypothetical protein
VSFSWRAWASLYTTVFGSFSFLWEERGGALTGAGSAEDDESEE